MDTLIYSKFSNERKKELSIKTSIHKKSDGELYVEKKGCSLEAKQHIKHIYEAYEKLKIEYAESEFKACGCKFIDDHVEMEYIYGETLFDKLEAMLKIKDYKNLKKEITNYITKVKEAHSKQVFHVTEEFKSVFGEVELHNEYMSGNVNNIDLVFDNVILSDGKMNIIDYEWTFLFPVPVEFIVYRILHYYVFRNVYKNELKENGIYDLLDVDEHDLKCFDSMERNFQSYIAGENVPVREMYGEFGKEFVSTLVVIENERLRQEQEQKIEREKKNNMSNYVKVYWSKGNEDFDEKMSKNIYVDPEKKPISLDIEINSEVDFIRIDPLEGKYIIVEIKNIVDEDGNDLFDTIKTNGIVNGKVINCCLTVDPWFFVETKSKKIHVEYEMVELGEDVDLKQYLTPKQYLSLFKPQNLARRVKNKLKKTEVEVADYQDPMHYHEWFMRHKATDDELKEQQIKQKEFEYRPKISILVPTYNTPIDMMCEMIDSVIEQSYDNWELCIADGSQGNAEIEEKLAEYNSKDSRVVYDILTENKGISGNTNGALAIATGDYIGLLDHDDVLEPNALYEVVKALQNGDVDIVYSDEDKVNADLSIYTDPNFKPDFSIDLFRSHNYITHLFVCKKSIVDEVGGFRSEFDGSQDYDLMFRCIEKSGKIYHIPKILYHWRMIEGSTADDPRSKMYCYEAGKHAIEEHLQRVGIDGSVEICPDMWGMYHTTYDVKNNPLVSIIIANKDLVSDLDKCIRSVENRSVYRNFEIVVVENNSTERETFDYYEKIQNEFSNVKVVYWEGEFNYSSINNYGVEHSSGEYILLLNNDTEYITPNALNEMLGICSRDDVGIVGAKLLYDDDTVQHAGVVIGFGGYAGHVFHGIDRQGFGYMLRPRINCNYSAVTAACLMTKRKVFDEVEGLTEAFKVAGNDVDYCLKVREKGYLVVYNAFSEWYHYESKSRGYEDTPEKKERFDREVSLFAKRWGEILENGDPYYNPNFPVTIAPFTLD